MPRAKSKPKSKSKTTSRNVASNAAKLLGSARTPRRVRSVAGSALAQASPARTETAEAADSPLPDFKAGKDLQE